ncbi:protein argonaute 2-like [Magnolia sinica]|uniref:protein argonaute 2-like n=1 Tax=Magnolia sinica TaxID=86752 RepID=UPI0026584DB4|nr:protein argonaute 2-like [Magnolia sinica]
MRENPSLSRIPFGRSFYYKETDIELGGGIISSMGFHQSLKPTAQGLSMCIDYKVIPLQLPVKVPKFLEEHLDLKFNANTSLNDKEWKRVEADLKELKVTVIHQKTSHKYVVAGLTPDISNNMKFENDKDSKRMVSVVEYFREIHGEEVEHKRLPCLDLTKNKRLNYVPMEFRVLVEEQRYPIESLHWNEALKIREKALITLPNLKEAIYEMIKDKDGPCG